MFEKNIFSLRRGNDISNYILCTLPNTASVIKSSTVRKIRILYTVIVRKAYKMFEDRRMEGRIILKTNFMIHAFQYGLH